MPWAIRNLVCLCWWGHGYDLIRKWMGINTRGRRPWDVCAHLGEWCGAVSQPVCVFFQSMATEHSGLQSVLDASVGLVRPVGPCQLPQPRSQAFVAVHLWRSKEGWRSETEALEWAQIFQSICDSCSLALKHWRKALYELAFPFVL